MQKQFLDELGVHVKSPDEIRFLSPLVYAYVGDAVYEIYVRTYVLMKYGGNVNALHRVATKFVKAGAQASVVHRLEQELSEEEWGIIRRGRNQKSGSVPKNADLTDYKYATGFEALIGYLYLMNRQDRIEQIIRRAMEIIDI